MSTVTLTKWGNSAGVRVPIQDMKAAKAHIGEKFELSINPQGGFLLTPIQNPQEGWLEAFNAIADAGDDKMLLQDQENDFDRDEWTW